MCWLVVEWHLGGLPFFENLTLHLIGVLCTWWVFTCVESQYNVGCECVGDLLVSWGVLIMVCIVKFLSNSGL